MNTLVFKMNDTLRSIIEHSRAHPDGQTVYGEPCPPSLMLVKDQGAYLMAPTNPRQLRENSESSVVVYAEGCDPSINADFYETARAICGGDDFCEGIALADFPAIDSATELFIELTEDSMTVGTKGPPVQ